MIKKLSLASVICFVIYFVLQFLIIFFPKLYLWAFASNLTVELPLSVQLSLVGQALCILPFGAVCFFSYFKKNITKINSYMMIILAPVLYFMKTILSNFIFMQTVNGDAVSNMGRDVDKAYQCIFMATTRASYLGKASLLLICCAGALSITKYKTSEINVITLIKKISLVSLSCFMICCMLQIEIIYFPDFYASNFFVKLSFIWQVLYILPFGAISFWNYSKKNMTFVTSMITVILAPLCYSIAEILSRFLDIEFFIGRLAFVEMENLLFDNGGNTLFTTMYMILSLVSLLQFASLVLICCTSTVALYNTKYEIYERNEVTL
ncbi:MAG: hypothetical protein HDT22_00410 [Ruminococcus sp.]|nr:hypothetical protein [Ruminococcus sp.]